MTSIDNYLKLTLPKLFALLFIFFSCIPFRIENLSPIIPAFDLIIIYYWAIYLPFLIPYWFTFSFSLLIDIFQGTPIALTALVNILFQAIISVQKRFFLKKPFIVAWFGFMLFSIGAFALKWMLISLFNNKLFLNKAVIVQWLLTFAIYPWMHLIFHKLYIYLIDKQHAR